VTRMLRVWTDAWSGWDAEELTVLACLYHTERFEACEAYLRRRLEAEAVHLNGANLFNKPLPSGLTMLEIAEVMRTPGCELLLEQAAKAAGEQAAAAADQAAAEPPAPAEGDALAEGDDAAAPAAVGEGETAVEWPEDGWVLCQTGFMVCALCKGRSGPPGRFGKLDSLPPSSVKHPFLVCAPCQKLHGLPEVTAEAAAPAEAWAEGVVRLVRRPGHEDGAMITVMVHPALGEIGH